MITPVPVPIKKEVKPPVKKETLKQKYLDTSKKIFAKKSKEENNSTKTDIKPTTKSSPITKILKKKKLKKKKKIVRKKVKTRVKAKKRIVKKRKKKRSKDSLANILMGSGTSYRPKKARSGKTGAYGKRMIKKLYGSEFNTFSPTQKKFIRRNLASIHKITQRTLTRNGYPSVAARTKQQGTNIVSFYLHPNGDITGLRLKRPIGYASLDENTLKVIRIAYQNYPLPNKKTKIIFYVNYRIH